MPQELDGLVEVWNQYDGIERAQPAALGIRPLERALIPQTTVLTGPDVRAVSHGDGGCSREPVAHAPERSVLRRPRHALESQL